MLPFERPDYRKENQLRHITIEPNFAAHAAGSVLVGFGNSKVICAATIEEKVPTWMKQQGITDSGWITAEYSMLPYSTLDRKPRELNRGKPEGRTVEIQRFIGRSLRAAVDLKKLRGYTLWLDCDVLQADGGTRTASVTGAYVAAKIAIEKLIKTGKLKESPFVDAIAAVSVGIFLETPILDLNYLEDKDAEVDMNLVMTRSGKFVELQGSGEESTFTEDQLSAMVDLGKQGLEQLFSIQEEVLSKVLSQPQ